MFTPQKTKEFEQRIKQGAHHIYKGEPLEGPLKCEVHCYFVKPKSAKRDYPCVKPDADNLLKAVLDGLNGVCFKDDAQFIDKYVTKRYAEEESIKVRITAI